MTGTPLTTLADFLLARIAEEKATASETMPSATGWGVGLERSPDRRSVIAHLVVPDDSVDKFGRAEDEVARTRWLTAARHIAHWDPPRVLAECDTNKRIVDLHAVVPAAPIGPNSGLMICLGCGDLAPCMTVRFLALPYVQHPDYQKVWLP